MAQNKPCSSLGFASSMLGKSSNTRQATRQPPTEEEKSRVPAYPGVENVIGEWWDPHFKLVFGPTSTGCELPSSG